MAKLETRSEKRNEILNLQILATAKATIKRGVKINRYVPSKLRISNSNNNLLNWISVTIKCLLLQIQTSKIIIICQS